MLYASILASFVLISNQEVKLKISNLFRLLWHDIGSLVGGLVVLNCFSSPLLHSIWSTSLIKVDINLGEACQYRKRTSFK